MWQGTGTANLKTKHANQAAVANESHDADPKINNLAFSKLLAQLIEQSGICRLMLSS